MSQEHLGAKLKQRFKGIENFLRKFSFNLGNTPSQTEVKIISCIPIDVTDLQQTIFRLERQLEDATHSNNSSAKRTQSKPSSVVHTVLCRSNLRVHAEEQGAGCDQPAPRFDSTLTDTGTIDDRGNPSCVCYTGYDNKRLYPKEAKRTHLYHKTKKMQKRTQSKSTLIYFAQTSSPFPISQKPKKSTARKSRERRKNKARHDYLSDIIQKQYTATPLVPAFSATSQISSPVCRDVESVNCRILNHCESEICSCCHGAFHNVDQYTNRTHENPIPSYSAHNTDFYDASLYDITPVKDTPIKIPLNFYESIKKKAPKVNKHFIDFEPTQLKLQIDPYIVNYSHVPNHRRKVPLKIAKTKQANPYRLEKSKHTETTKSCCIDLGDTYPKQITRKPPIDDTKKLIVKKNAESLTVNTNDSVCQTTTTQSAQIDSELEFKTTDDTLNQIKVILQSVLTEVKTSSEVKKGVDKFTKDAVVQKGTSQGNMYYINPYLSCSQQISSSYPIQITPSPNNTKCFQNFPVFIQTPGRQMCSCCIRNNPVLPKPIANKASHPKVNSQNTRNETESLIKEIYKSMAVNILVPPKVIPELKEVKSSAPSTNKSVCRSSLHGSRKSSVSSRSDQRTQSTAASQSSKIGTTTASGGSRVTSTTDTEQMREHRVRSYMQRATARTPRTTRIEEVSEYEQAQEVSTSEEDTESSSEDTSRERYMPQKMPNKVACVSRLQQQNWQNRSHRELKQMVPEKHGLLRKIIDRSAKLFGKTKKERTIQEEDEESEGSVTDHTVYEQPQNQHQRITHPTSRSYVAKKNYILNPDLDRRPAENPAMSDMWRTRMDQELRRQWNERLMFHDNRRKYSSLSPYGPTTGSTRNRTYHHNETRSVPRDEHPVMIRDTSPRTVIRKNGPKFRAPSKGLPWLKKQRLVRCGQRWKKFIVEH